MSDVSVPQVVGDFGGPTIRGVSGRKQPNGPIATDESRDAAAEKLMREIIINQRDQNSRLGRENQLLRKQNNRLRAALRHRCPKCGEPCPEQQKVAQAVLGEAIP